MTNWINLQRQNATVQNGLFKMEITIATGTTSLLDHHLLVHFQRWPREHAVVATVKVARDLDLG